MEPGPVPDDHRPAESFRRQLHHRMAVLADPEVLDDADRRPRPGFEQSEGQRQLLAVLGEALLLVLLVHVEGDGTSHMPRLLCAPEPGDFIQHRVDLIHLGVGRIPGGELVDDPSHFDGARPGGLLNPPLLHRLPRFLDLVPSANGGHLLGRHLPHLEVPVSSAGDQEGPPEDHVQVHRDPLDQLQRLL
ncbi:unnamed protein product [Spirodela intermedia]|uniref:Uncharacterized protein n=1 Tax=Spirodela intermedia TaxID=51605 RepID=A0A7I8LA81_SPIIN|nr:unnamed protein product [Spirodela intermedia]